MTIGRAQLFAAILLAIATPKACLAEQVSVDFLSSLRPLTHAGSGFLHSFSTTAPPDNLVAPLKPQLFRSWNEAGNTGIFPTYNRVTAMGAASQLVVSDVYGYGPILPGDGGNWADWEKVCRDQATRALREGKTIQFDIWNEPDIPGFWSRTKEQWLETWKRGVQAIRSVDPAATIVGPSIAIYGNATVPMHEFLTYARDNNVLPNVISWHQFNGFITEEVADYRAFTAAQGININRISLNEIVFVTDQYKPGVLPRYFGGIERNGIENAAHACWGEATGADSCSNLSLDGLLTSDTKQPRSTWWTYERYGEMAGTSVSTVPSNTLDSVASFKDGAAYVLLGRFVTPGIGNADVVLNNLGAVPNLIVNGQVHVRAERIVDSGIAASAGPIAMIDANFSVVGGQLSLALPSFNGNDAYFLMLTAPVASNLLGDFNGDGTVNAADYVVWRNTNGTATAYEQWRSHFGQTSGSGANGPLSESVPEPATFVTLLAGILLFGFKTRPMFVNFRRVPF
jgi:hypothetical protein